MRLVKRELFISQNSITHLSRHFPFVQESFARVHALCISSSPVGVHSEFVEQPVLVDPILYQRRVSRVSDGQALLANS